MTSWTWEKHLKHLDEVLNILEEHSLYAKMSKCEFGMKEMLYLGHIISEKGVQVDMEKIWAIRDWPTPKIVTKLRGFLGLCTYYQRYVKGFSQFAAPLTDLTKKGAFTLDRTSTKNFRGDESQYEFLPSFSITGLLTTICSRMWCLGGRARSSVDAKSSPYCIWEP